MRERVNLFLLFYTANSLLMHLLFHLSVNFWYDMAYDIRYSYFKFVESLVCGRNDDDQSSVSAVTESEPDVSESDDS